MKPILIAIIILLAVQCSFAQEQSIELIPAMVDTSHQIFIAKMY